MDLTKACISKMRNGDILITYPDAEVPALCVQKKDGQVRKAYTELPVTNPSLVKAAQKIAAQQQ
jgi:hypothetical protein